MLIRVLAAGSTLAVGMILFECHFRSPKVPPIILQTMVNYCYYPTHCSPMHDWENSLSLFLVRSGDSSSVAEMRLPSATENQIHECETSLGLEFPSELKDLYLFSNGLVLEDDKTQKPRFIRALDKLCEFVHSAKSSFSETHESFAKRYFPFIDWINGDSSGYMLNPDAEFEPEIFIFLHEHYNYTADQDINEFLQPFSTSLAAVFTG